MNFPDDFLSQTQNILGDESRQLIESIAQDAPVSIRINPSKAKPNLALEGVKWCENGFYLPQRPSFTFDPLFHAGCYYPQEASSMFVGHAVKPFLTDNVRVLDLCAAPGGKSTHLVSLLTPDSLLVANEVIRSRANILAENVAKSGYPNVVVTSNDPAEIGAMGAFFDVMLVDAPCSGEGMFRKDAASVGEWSTANVCLCRDRQRRILSDVWKALKPGGIILYSTCTYNCEEDEINVEWICSELGAESIETDVDGEWNISGKLVGCRPVYRFFPHKTKGEGFFLAVLRKNESDAPYESAKPLKNKKNDNKPFKPSDDCRSMIQTTDIEFDFVPEGNYLNAIPKLLVNDLHLLKSKLRVVTFGITLGETKGKDFVPHQSLALSLYLNRNAFVCYDVDYAMAIAFLRKEALVIDSSLPKSYILITYKDMPLGFVKNIGNRANNLYPQEWRIRSANVPDEAVSVL